VMVEQDLRAAAFLGRRKHYPSSIFRLFFVFSGF
jgi:hypothetical protein